MKNKILMVSIFTLVIIISGAFAFKAKNTGFYVFKLSDDQQSCGLVSGMWTFNAPRNNHWNAAVSSPSFWPIRD